MSEPTVLWQPSAEKVADANLTKFRAWLAERSVGVDSFEDLYQWSIDEAPTFWSLLAEFVGVTFRQSASSTVENWPQMPGTRWFPGARLNFAENLLCDDDHPALVAWNEAGRQGQVTYAELRQRVAGLAAALRAHGIRPGDRVAGYLPNVPETVIAMLGAAAVGATWSSCSPDFGIGAAMDRFGQIEPRLLIAADGYVYAGKRIEVVDRVAELASSIDSVERVVMISYLDASPDLSAVRDVVDWDEFVEDDPAELTFEGLPFEHPLYILYSSGTTGLPKCIVHGAGGTLLQHLKELVLHTDLTRDDVLFYYTTCGWMMWNWLVSGLAVGATLVLVDGSPFGGGDGHLFRMAQDERVTVFGVSAKYLAECEKRGLQPRQSFDVTSIRAVLSTGSPLLPSSFDYVYREIGDDLCLSSISGGTDIVSCFALGNPTGPVHRGELQTRGLGMRVEVFDPGGEPMVETQGELVCTQPFPSMPVGFWNDADGSRYRSAYFEKYDGVWAHGDWVTLTGRGSLRIFGRSDATLNPGGVRIGTAEIYRQVETFDEVREAVVIGQDWNDDVRVVLFVILHDGVTLDGALRERIRKRVRAGASPHHQPRRIVQVTDIPRTVSGKISELAVRNVVMGRPVENAQALANPQALEQYRDRPELRA